jgi:VanZ family protein
MVPSDQAKRRKRWILTALVLGVVWVVFFAYLLLSADPPDLWFDDIGAVDGPGHVVGGVVTGAGAYLLLNRHRRAAQVALGSTLVLLLGLELLQDRFTSRGYETSDVVLSVVGAVIGVGAARLGHRMMNRRGD